MVTYNSQFWLNIQYQLVFLKSIAFRFFDIEGKEVK